MTIDSVSSETTTQADVAAETNDEARVYIDETGAPVAQARADEPSPVILIQRTTANYVVIAAVFLLLGMFIGGFAVYHMERSDRAWVSQAVADAFDAQAGTLADMVAAARPPSLDDPNSRFDVAAVSDYYRGGADAPVEIIEFGDFNCGYCGRFHRETLQPILDTYGDNVRYVYRDYPILADTSLTAAMASRCAGEQGQYWGYHDMLFDNQGTFASTGAFASFANQLGLDMDKFNTCLDSQQYLDPVVADYRAAQSLGIRGTPAFFINGRPVIGAQPYDSFARIINEELDANGIDTSQFAVPEPESSPQG